MSPARPVGRRPGDPEQTKAAILDAARRQFAEAGFDRATIRAIAAAADVDPALVMHHFGSKQGLFAAAHELPFEPAELVATVLAVPAEQRAERIARIYLGTAISGSAMVSLLRAAATNEAAARMMSEFVRSALVAHASELVEGPDAELRVALVGVHLMGVVYGREILRLPELTEPGLDDLVAAVAPAIQRHLDGR